MGDTRKFQKGIGLNDTKSYSFPQRIIKTWNGLKEEGIMERNVQLKERVVKYRYRDRTT